MDMGAFFLVMPRFFGGPLKALKSRHTHIGMSYVMDPAGPISQVGTIPQRASLSPDLFVEDNIYIYIFFGVSGRKPAGSPCFFLDLGRYKAISSPGHNDPRRDR